MNETESNENHMEQKCPQCGAPLPSGVLAGLCPACLMKQGAAAETGAGLEPAPFQPPGVEEVAKLFPQLEIIALIGKGGMGAVYKARQAALDRIVALKILPPQTAAGPGFVERFNREARALARLNHPNIVAVYEFGQAGGLSFFIMEFVDGLNLRELERAGKLSPAQALQIVPQICDALQFAHDEGIVHRDIKPENIMLDKRGRVKIADFGIAKILTGPAGTDLTKTQGVMGTPHYMAPEQMEKPTAVDHRADIFSLGVVFYEMLTGELPLGKFAPPSSRKVEVDVRLDEVVLRTLEKDPERRYQHASQVKTAVDTIAGTTAPPRGANTEGMAREILMRDYTLGIRSCLRRGWRLLMEQFWVFVGITALFLALFGFAGSFGGVTLSRNVGGGDDVQIGSAVAILVSGPLWGGLMYYFLRKIRREPTTVEAAFCGFSHRFLHLFLAGFVTSLLTWIGFFFLILPGIFLLVAWMFTLPIVIDQQVDFWSAMELSRKVVTKHWFKCFGFGLVLAALMCAGALAFGIGILVASPWILASLLYAYDDIFGGATGVAPAAAGTGPSGTVVMPAAPVLPAATRAWGTATKLGLATVVIVLVIGIIVLLAAHSRRLAEMQRDTPDAIQPDNAVMPDLATNPVVSDAAEPASTSIATSFDETMELELTNGAAVKLASTHQKVLPGFVLNQVTSAGRDTIICTWMNGADVDIAWVDNVAYSMTRSWTNLKRDSWDRVSVTTLAEALSDTGQEVGTRLENSGLNNPTNYTYAFKTRDGLFGVLQVEDFEEDPVGVKVRYKLLRTTTNAVAHASGTEMPEVRVALLARLDAASAMSDVTRKDKPLAGVVMDAANAGDVDIVRRALSQMFYPNARDTAARDSALVLNRRGQRKQAVDIAKGITDYTILNQTLSDLAN